MTDRQPVIIMRRGRRVDMEASVFPVVMDEHGDIATGAAMAHGTDAECAAWIDASAEHVVLYGRTSEVDSRFGSYGDQVMMIRRAVAGRPVPARCLWRPPEERIAALAEARARVEQMRGQVSTSMSALRSFADSAVEMIGESTRIDANAFERLCWNAKSDASRYVDAVDRLAKLTEE